MSHKPYGPPRPVTEIASFFFLHTVWDREIRSELEIRKLGKQIQERKKNWLQHLQRMPSERAFKQLVYIINR
jgi:hypothetical protein